VVKFNIIAFTHNSIGLAQLGKFHLEKEEIATKMNALKLLLGLDELMYLSTCNRVEFIFVQHESVHVSVIKKFVQTFNPEFEEAVALEIAQKARHWNGINAVNHLIEVACSLDSMVLGEREIITQVRNAYTLAKKEGLSGDVIRIVMRQTIETAKKVYTETALSERSVSVVSLAYQELMKHKLPKKPKILVIGAGVTNQNLCKFLKKDGLMNWVVFNRTYENAVLFTDNLGGTPMRLDELQNYTGGFDVILTCTGAARPVLTPNIYQTILRDSKTKVIVDLAIPADVDATICKAYPVQYISVETLKEISDKNLLLRRQELLKVRQLIFSALEDFKAIFEMRQVEIKMQSIPNHVKAIRQKAMEEIFHKDVEEMDEKSKQILHKILNYMEKKYVSVPMIMAKEMLTKIN
jgi:glutamyl-tRNA reductase